MYIVFTMYSSDQNPSRQNKTKTKKKKVSNKKLQNQILDKKRIKNFQTKNYKTKFWKKKKDFSKTQTNKEKHCAIQQKKKAFVSDNNIELPYLCNFLGKLQGGIFLQYPFPSASFVKNMYSIIN